MPGFRRVAFAATSAPVPEASSMTSCQANPYTTDDPTLEPLRTLLARLGELQPELDTVDLDIDLNERDTYALMLAMGVSASSGE